MGVGLRLKEILRAKSLTIKQLAEVSGVSINTLYSITKRDSERVDEDIIQRIAAALGVSVSDLLGQEKQEAQHGPWSFSLEQKLAAVGCSIGFYEEDAALWINYPAGTLEVTEEELKALNDSADSFLRFKLAELKESRKADFRPKK